MLRNRVITCQIHTNLSACIIFNTVSAHTMNELPPITTKSKLLCWVYNNRCLHFGRTSIKDMYFTSIRIYIHRFRFCSGHSHTRITWSRHTNLQVIMNTNSSKPATTMLTCNTGVWTQTKHKVVDSQEHCDSWVVTFFFIMCVCKEVTCKINQLIKYTDFWKKFL